MKENASSEIKVILVGEMATGKTSLINATMGLKFQETMVSTTINSFSSKTITINSKKYNLNLWDTIGQEKYRSLTKIFIKDSKIVLFVYDITRKNTFKELDFWYKVILDILDDEPILGICGNKSDLIMKEEVPEEMIKKYSMEKNIPYKLTSAKDPLTFNKFLEDLIIKYIEKNKGNFRKKKDEKMKLKKDTKTGKKKCC